ncbi:MAG: ABC transporter permease [Coriobacteriia bacterium]|nr:ABC transporter permease [Coriobacteriia bacterium]
MTDVITGAVALGLVWAIVSIGVWITYRILDFPDLTVEGTIVTGAATTAIMITHGVSPLLCLLASFAAGALCGLITAFLHTRLKIPALLAGILTNIGLYSINIRIMAGTSNISLLGSRSLIDTFMSFITRVAPGGSHSLLARFLTFLATRNMTTILIVGIGVICVIALSTWFLRTSYGCSIRATGSNPDMARAQGININMSKTVGLMLSNAFVGLGGSLLCQYQGYSDVQMGIGCIVIGLASLIIGEVLFGKSSTLHSLISVSLGAILYRIIIALVIQAGMQPTDLKLFTAITVALALFLPTAIIQVKHLRGRLRRRHDAGL